jgi:O-glycosyl hydrolase
MLTFVKNNTPVIGIKIIVPESYYQSRVISDAILNDLSGVSNISIIGIHMYRSKLSKYPLGCVQRERSMNERTHGLNTT